MSFVVYMAVNKTNGKAYVGKSCRGLALRKRDHATATVAGDTVFGRALRKYGMDGFEWRVLYEGVDAREIDFVERGMIAQYGTFLPRGYNATSGGDGGNASGTIVKCVETKQCWVSLKACAAHFGARGFSQLRRAVNNPTRTYHGFHFVSSGYIPAAAAAHHTKPNSVRVMCVETGEIWPSQTACAKAIGNTKSTVNLYKCLDKPNRSWLGRHFVSKDFDKGFDASKTYKVRPKPRKIACVETGKTWPTQTACVLELSGTKATGHLYPCLDKPNRTWMGLHFVSATA